MRMGIKIYGGISKELSNKGTSKELKEKEISMLQSIKDPNHPYMIAILTGIK